MPQDLDEELLAREELEADKQQERLMRMQQREEEEQTNRQNRQNMMRRVAEQKAKQIGKQVATQVAKKAAKRAGAALFRSVLLYTSPVWGGLFILFLLIILIAGTYVAACNSSYAVGARVGATGFFASIPGLHGLGQYLNNSVCGGISATNFNFPADTPAPANTNIVLTSAYRPGSFVDGDPNRPSAHGRGEAFDVALNPPLGFSPGPEPRLVYLISVARSLGFVPPVGDVVDEYNNPSPGTTGPHVHIEFNNTYCSGSEPTKPPNDLVDIPSWIPQSGVSNPQVRACMLPNLVTLFEIINTAESPQ